MPSGQDYTRRLQEEARKTLEPQLLNLEERCNSLQDQFLSSIDQVRQKVAALRNGDIDFGGDIVAEAASEAVRLNLQERQKEMAFLSHFSNEMRRKETQEEILTHLMDGAQLYAPRTILFVIRGNELTGWSSRGYDEGSARKIIGWTIQAESSDLLREALSADGLITVRDVSKESDLLKLLPGNSAPWHAFPMHAVRRRVAVLLAAGGEEKQCDLEPLSLLMDVTGLRIENIALKILQEMKVSASAAPKAAPEAPSNQESVEPPVRSESAEAAAGSPEAPPPEADEVTGRTAAAEAEAAESLPVETEEVDAEGRESGAPDSARTEEGEAAPSFKEETTDEQTLDSSTPDAEKELPSHEPILAAAGSTDVIEPDSPSGPPAVEQEETGEAAGEDIAAVRIPGLEESRLSTEEEKLHSDAKRFARLLVSEIKLYNEQRLADGRQNRDIYVRLQRDIDRSREMYQKRVSPDVARKVDYFHDEVIRILADNDPTTLGSEYPGPSVES